MNVGKSIKVALAKRGMKSGDLATALGVTPSTISVMSGRETCTGHALIRLSAVFEMKVSEFVALGED